MTLENQDWMKKQRKISENLILDLEIILKIITRPINLIIKESQLTWLSWKSRLKLRDKLEWELIILKWVKIPDISSQCIMQHIKSFHLILPQKHPTKTFEKLTLFSERKEFHIKQHIRETIPRKRVNETLIHQQFQEDSKELIFSLVMIILQRSQALIFITCIILEALNNLIKKN